jgi:hypothetical protein
VNSVMEQETWSLPPDLRLKRPYDGILFLAGDVATLFGFEPWAHAFASPWFDGLALVTGVLSQSVLQ